MKNELTFAQLSDPHLSSLENVHWSDLASKRLLGYLSWRKRRRAEHRSEVLESMQRDLRQTAPEHLVITGDLTHISLPDEFRQARDWLESLGTPGDVTVIPGNHDAYVEVPWEKSFAHWQPWMVSDEMPESNRQTPSSETVFPSLRIRGPVAFIGLSSARPSAPFLATGRIGADQLERLGEILELTRRQGLFRVVLLHHPPVPGEEKWRKRLTDADSFCRVIARFGAELVLHGHRHRAVQSRIEIPGTHVPVFGIPSASSSGHQPERAAQYYLYRVGQSDNTWKLDVAVMSHVTGQNRFSVTQESHLEMPRQSA
ncbi:MAG: metallophosphoesterase [Gammaproteobacteria bacterium]|nr:MAG: metallophosphoesterase [Gammaproteobacteria bacterium]